MRVPPALLVSMVALSISASSAASRSNDIMILEFTNRQIVLDDLNTKYNLYVSSPFNDVEERAARKRAFVNGFNYLFNNTDQWIVDVMTENDPSKNLLAIELIRNKRHLALTEAFLTEVTKAFKQSILLHIRFNNLMDNDQTALTTLRDSGDKALKNVRDNTVTYLKTNSWTRQFKEDIKEFVQYSHASGRLELDLVKMLKNKFPFRKWLIISRKEGTKQWVHCNIKGENFEISTPGNRRILVVQAPEGHGFNKHLAADHVNKIKAEGAHPMCRSRAKSIFDEMEVSCARNSHIFVGVVGFAEDRSRPMVVSSDPNMYRDYRVLRTFWIFCRRYYSAVIFG